LERAVISLLLSTSRIKSCIIHSETWDADLCRRQICPKGKPLGVGGCHIIEICYLGFLKF
ncbi:MAG: hypothetical protein KKB29_02625, partial [Nanoarchaeota archaeon]|nr:hypothetical protein [Nanoarchaeota archaeon]